MDGWTDGRTDGPTDRPTDGWSETNIPPNWDPFNGDQWPQVNAFTISMRRFAYISGINLYLRVGADTGLKHVYGIYIDDTDFGYEAQLVEFGVSRQAKVNVLFIYRLRWNKITEMLWLLSVCWKNIHVACELQPDNFLHLFNVGQNWNDILKPSWYLLAGAIFPYKGTVMTS